MPHLTAAGHRLEYELVEGRGPTLVFLHEGLGSISQWRDFPRALAAATGCPALVYSRWGYGQSDPVDLPRPLDFMHDEARRALPEILEQRGIDEAILVGHSDGASIAIIHAGEGGPRIRGLVLEAPNSRIAQLNEEHAYVELADADRLELGQEVRVVPNHACVVSNLFDEFVVTLRGEVVDGWPVDARGQSR